MLELSKKTLFGAGVAAATAILAGCGGPSYGSAPSTGSSSSSGHRATKFSVATVSGFGKVLVDGKGRTVYILTSGGHTNAPCTDASGCTKVWPDLPLPSGAAKATTEMGADASLLGTKKLSDGETYPTYNGWLMYEYTGDSGPGQANGEGIKSFGGTWYVLNAAGDPVKSSSGGSGDSGY